MKNQTEGLRDALQVAKIRLDEIVKTRDVELEEMTLSDWGSPEGQRLQRSTDNAAMAALLIGEAIEYLSRIK